MPILAGQLTFNLFPASGLDNSLFTAILLGLLLLFVLTESFGWVFTGLVVPGYLASVFVIQPVAGGVILIEAITTYVLARGLSDWGSRFLPYNRFFGRERFFLILLISVAVRLVFEALLLPELGTALAEDGWVPPSLVANLFSVGLIVVPLTANMMWRTGAWAGLPQVVLPTATIYAALWFVLIPYTNLSISDFELTYENVALGFLASPKTYIILLTGAYLATRNSLAWGWDSHGIVVMALIALAWLSPMKVATTVVEVLVLVAAVKLLLALPLAHAANLEGYRRIVIVFGIGFVLKFIACHAMAATYPGLRATDYFGFGYLLPSLLALKVLQRGSASIVLLPTLQTSLLALALGTLLGMGLALLDPGKVEAAASSRDTSGVESRDGSVVSEVQRACGTLLCGLPPAVRRGVDARADLLTFRRLVRELAAGSDPGDLKRRASSLGLQMSGLTDPQTAHSYLLLDEPAGKVDDLQGWGIVIVDADARSPLVIEVPHPVSEPGSLIAGATLMRELGASVLVISGVDPGAEAELWASARASLSLVAARRGLAGRPALEVRAPPTTANSVMWVRGDVPSGLDFGALEAAAGEVEQTVSAPPGADVYGYAPEGERARLDLSPQSVRAAELTASTGRERADRQERGGLSALAGRDWFLDQVAAVGYRPPLETERVGLERLVLGPLFDHAGSLAADGAHRDYLDQAASLHGYGLERIELGDGEPLLLLSEEAPAVRGWGSVLVRPAAGTARFVAVPKPAEERYTLDLALHLLRDLDGAALAIAGAEPHAALDESSNVVGAGNLETLFTQVHRVALRHDEGQALGLQVRGYRSWRPLRAPVILATGVLAADMRFQPGGMAAVERRLASIGVPVRGFDGSAELVSLRGYGIPQIHVARNLDGLPYGVVWASRALRRRVAIDEGETLTRTAIRAGLEPQQRWLDRVWQERVAGAAARGASLEDPPVAAGSAWNAVLSHCAALIRTGDQRYLGDAVEGARAAGIDITWLVDLESGLPVLLLDDGQRLAAVNLLTSDADFHVEIEDPVASLRTGLVPLLMVEDR